MDSLERQEVLTRPLLPRGDIDVIVEESLSDHFNDFTGDPSQYDPSQYDPSQYDPYQAVNNGLEFPTSVSSTSTGSFIDSTELESSADGNNIATDSATSIDQPQRAFVSDSSSSLNSSSGSFYNGYPTYINKTHGYALPRTTEAHPISSSSYVEVANDHDPLKDIEPSINPVPNFTMSDYLPANVTIEFINLEKRIFEKMQSRKDKKARQRIMCGKVKISVISDEEIGDLTLKVWVRREKQAASLCNDKNGEVELKKPIMLKHTNGERLFVVDLDSEYEGKERPVYELAKVEMNERNLFELVAQVTLKNGQKSGRFASKPFLIRTHKRNYQEEVQSSGAPGNKRPNTWHSSLPNRKYPRGSPRPSSAEDEADSSVSPRRGSFSGSSVTNTMNVDKLILDHLEAQMGHINHLTVGSIKTKRGDIAYHIKLTDQAQDKNLTEGVVVGFFPSDGKTKIEPLSSQNVDKAVMAGVVSRSAYVEAEVPGKNERGSTDAVCVIGMIGVQVQGTILAGERIYTSSENDGVAVPESHLPIGSFVTKETTMLGMAMEPNAAKKPGDHSLVKCFVCIVLGISSLQVAREVQNVLNSMETNLKSEVKKSSKRTWRRIYCWFVLAFVLLAAIGFFLYEFFAPGTAYRYWRCSIGAKPGHYMKYKFPWDGKEVQIHGLEFDFDVLKKKLMKLSVETMRITKFPNTKTGNEVRYYLNVDRCAYGGETDGGFWHKTVKGGLVLVNACPCNQTYEPVFKFVDYQFRTHWCAYFLKKALPNTMKCEPTTCTEEQRNFHYPTFKGLNNSQKCLHVDDAVERKIKKKERK